MSDPIDDGARQRLLEHALYEVLGGDAQDASDLAPQVRAAWEGGQRVASDPDAPEPPRLPEPAATAAAPRWVPWAAAAGLALAAGGAWWSVDGRAVDPSPHRSPHRNPQSTAGSTTAEAAPQSPELLSPSNAAARESNDAPAAIDPKTLAAAELLSEKLDELYVKGMPPEMAREIILGSYREGALSALRRSPEIWPHVGDVFDGLLDPDEQPLYVRRDLIRALAVDESDVVLGRLRSAWLEQPEAFTIDVVVTLAERGAFEFEREASAWLASFRLSAPGESLPGDPLTGAVYGALRGNERAVPTLEFELKSDVSGERSLLAAVGLARLGRGTAWLDRFEGYVESIRALLDSAELSSSDEKDLASQIDALSYALALHDGTRLSAFEPTVEWDGTPRVGDLVHWLDLYRRTRSQEVRDRAALASELEALLDR